MEKEDATSSIISEEIRIERYKGSKNWGVWQGEKLLAVTVYKRGAESVAEMARELSRRHPSLASSY